MTGEWSQYYHRGSLHDLEVLHARFIEHRFARHSHDYYVIGFVEAGVQAYSYRGARHLTPAGQIFLVNPGEPHTGEAATHGGYIYRTAYPRVALMQQVAAEVTTRNALPFFTAAVIRDESLSERLLRFHYAVAKGAPTLSVESTLIDALAYLIRRHADDRRSRSCGLNERTAVRKAREYIEAHYDADVSLCELATLVHLSPFLFRPGVSERGSVASARVLRERTSQARTRAAASWCPHHGRLCCRWLRRPESFDEPVQTSSGDDTGTNCAQSRDCWAIDTAFVPKSAWMLLVPRRGKLWSPIDHRGGPFLTIKLASQGLTLSCNFQLWILLPSATGPAATSLLIVPEPSNDQTPTLGRSQFVFSATVQLMTTVSGAGILSGQCVLTRPIDQHTIV